MKQNSRSHASPRRFGIGEWFGKSFSRLSVEERQFLAGTARTGKHKNMPCRYKGNGATCSKAGGVCSLREYEQDISTGQVRVPPGPAGRLVTTCPARFEEAGTVYRWIGETILGTPDPQVVGEVGFLERGAVNEGGAAATGGREDVGRIDNILVRQDAKRLMWCAMEIQAVYFSGAKMTTEFAALAAETNSGIPFPVGRRRPDYRSSGPKRLMPQLQIKVPTLRRWGKKMAVVVDESFFGNLGQMSDVAHLSNCDIVWFVVHYDDSDGEPVLRPGAVRLTTLEDSVEGLTAGHPVSLAEFEARILQKLH